MKIFLITYWLIVVGLDWSSTIAAHDWRVEENPLMREVWRRYGDVGFTLASIFWAVILTIAIKIGMKYGYKWSIISSALVMITFKFLIALTNLAVIPYWVTGWFTF